jgi:hypothetical protein
MYARSWQFYDTAEKGSEGEASGSNVENTARLTLRVVAQFTAVVCADAGDCGTVM